MKDSGLNGSALGVRLDTVAVKPAESRADEDALLVQQALVGDILAFKELVNKYQQRLFAIAFGVVGSSEDAEDIVQEAFLKIYRNLSSFRGQSSFYTWAYRITYNVSIDWSRRRYRRTEQNFSDEALFEHAVNQAVDIEPSSVAPEFEYSPERSIERRELRENLSKAMGRLSPAHRAVIVLREIEGLSYKEISRVVGCTKGTVMSRLFHARKRLQEYLQSA